MKLPFESFGKANPAAIAPMLGPGVNCHNQVLSDLGAKYQVEALHQQTKSLGPEDPATTFRVVSHDEVLSLHRMAKEFYLGLEIETPASMIAAANVDGGIAQSRRLV